MAKRIALIAAVIVLLALIILPPIFGDRARALLEPRINAMFDASFDDWDAGWFTSTTTVTLGAQSRAPGQPAAIDPDLRGAYETTVPVVITLHHGPVMFSGVPRVGWGSAEFVFDATTIPDLREFHADTGIEEIARLTALVGFRETSIDLEMPAFSTAGDDHDEQIRFSGLDATFRIGHDDARVGAFGTLHGLAVATPEASAFEVGRLEWTASAYRNAATGHSWLGDGSAEIERVFVSIDDAPGTAEINDARIEVSARVDGDDIAGNNRYTAAIARFGTIQLADAILDVTATYPIAAAVRLAESAYSTNVDSALPNEVLTEALLRERITLHVDPLSFRYADMPFDATLEVEYRGDQHGITPAADDFAKLARVTSASLVLSMHKRLVEEIGGSTLAVLVPVMVHSEIVRESGDQYTVQATWRDGELLFDDKPADLALLALLFGL